MAPVSQSIMNAIDLPNVWHQIKGNPKFSCPGMCEFNIIQIRENRANLFR